MNRNFSQIHRARVLWYCRRTQKDREMRFVQNYSSTFKVLCARWSSHRTFSDVKERQSRERYFRPFQEWHCWAIYGIYIAIEQKEMRYRWGLSFVFYVLKYLCSKSQLLNVFPKSVIRARAEASFRDTAPLPSERIWRETLKNSGSYQLE